MGYNDGLVIAVLRGEGRGMRGGDLTIMGESGIWTVRSPPPVPGYGSWLKAAGAVPAGEERARRRSWRHCILKGVVIFENKLTGVCADAFK